MSEHERHAENLAAYALGALDPAAAADIERHLEECLDCTRELRQLELARDVLPAAIPPAKPPRALKRRVMGEVRADARTRREPASRPLSPWIPRAAAGAAALALTAVALVLATGGDETTVIAAKPTDAAPANVAATLERDGESATLRVERMPLLGRGEAYQLWIQRSGRMTPSSVFTLDPDGSAATPVKGSLEDAEAVVLTREPLAGSPQPTSAPLLAFPLSS